MNVTVRPAVTNDAATIHQFICELEEKTFSFEVFQAIYQKNLVTENYLYLVSIDDTNVVRGFLSCHGQHLLHHCGLVFEIQEMFVDKESRRNGVGMSLMIALDEWLHKLNYQSLEVTAHINRLDTHAYYRAACGFRETHKKFTKDKHHR